MSKYCSLITLYMPSNLLLQNTVNSPTRGFKIRKHFKSNLNKLLSNVLKYITLSFAVIP